MDFGRVNSLVALAVVALAVGCASVRLDPAAADTYLQPLYVRAAPAEVADAIVTAVRSGAPPMRQSTATVVGGGAVRLDNDTRRLDQERWRLGAVDVAEGTLHVTHVRGVFRPRDEVTVRLYAIDATTTEVMAFSRGRWGLFGRGRQWRTLRAWMQLLSARFAADGLTAQPAAP